MILENDIIYFYGEWPRRDRFKAKGWYSQKSTPPWSQLANLAATTTFAYSRVKPVKQLHVKRKNSLSSGWLWLLLSSHSLSMKASTLTFKYSGQWLYNHYSLISGSISRRTEPLMQPMVQVTMKPIFSLAQAHSVWIPLSHGSNRGPCIRDKLPFHGGVPFWEYHPRVFTIRTIN